MELANLKLGEPYEVNDDYSNLITIKPFGFKEPVHPFQTTMIRELCYLKNLWFLNIVERRLNKICY